jgi:hypothetical protein
MSKLVWDQAGQKLYETGVKQGVVYPQSAGAYPAGIAWNGLVSVTESPSGAEPNPIYADDIKYLSLTSAEQFAASVEAYTYPDEFAACDGSAALGTGVAIGQQARQAFGLAYKTIIGNDLTGEAYGYKLHLIYGATAAPSEKAYKSINDSPEAITFSWDVSTVPVSVTGKKPTASLVIDSTKVDPAKLATLEDLLFGTAGASARLPLPDEITTIVTGGTIAAPSVTILPLDDAASVAKTANIVMTFNNAIVQEAIVVTSAAGVLVAGAKTWDTAKKVLTFDPTTDFTGTTTYIVTIGGVVDVYGQTLAASVKNFATVA